MLGREIHWEKMETGGAIVTTIGGTLIVETGMIVEGTTSGMTATATGMITGIEMYPKISRLSHPRGSKKIQVSIKAPPPPRILILRQVPPVPEPRVQSEGLEDGQEEGESMDAVDQDDEAMMALMGIGGFGSTKVRVFSMWTY